jgi:hypothetical protein
MNFIPVPEGWSHERGLSSMPKCVRTCTSLKCELFTLIPPNTSTPPAMRVAVWNDLGSGARPRGFSVVHSEVASAVLVFLFSFFFFLFFLQSSFLFAHHTHLYLKRMHHSCVGAHHVHQIKGCACHRVRTLPPRTELRVWSLSL